MDPDGRDIVWSEYWQGFKQGSVELTSKLLNQFLWVGAVFSVPIGGAAGRFDKSLTFHLLSDRTIAKDRADAGRAQEELKQTLAQGPAYTGYAATKSFVLGTGRPIATAAKSGFAAAASEGPDVERSRAFGEATPDALLAAGEIAALKSGLARTSWPTVSPSLVTAEGAVLAGPGVQGALAPGRLLGGSILMAAANEQGGASEGASTEGKNPSADANGPSPKVTFSTKLAGGLTPLQGGILFQSVVDRAAKFLFADAARFRLVLSPRQYFLGTTQPWLANIFVGTGIERYTGTLIDELKLPFIPEGGAFNPDFLGKGPLSGNVFDVFANSEAAYFEHMNRPYGATLNLQVGVYERPSRFHLLPR